MNTTTAAETTTQTETPTAMPEVVPERPLTVVTRATEYSKQGKWWGPAELFPDISVDQATRVVTVVYHSAADPSRRYGKTWEHSETISSDGQAVLIRGMCGYKNLVHPQCGGRQQFCFAVFVGDSGHVYTHRAPATRGWMECRPEDITARLVKLGIGAVRGVIQQGDYLLKPANGNALPEEEFKHEYMGSGHHRFEVPVLRAWSGRATHVLIREPVRLVHHAVDGIQHPDVVVPAGQYIIGTTASSLRHANGRD